MFLKNKNTQIHDGSKYKWTHNEMHNLFQQQKNRFLFHVYLSQYEFKTSLFYMCRPTYHLVLGLKLFVLSSAVFVSSSSSVESSSVVDPSQSMSPCFQSNFSPLGAQKGWIFIMSAVNKMSVNLSI